MSRDEGEREVEIERERERERGRDREREREKERESGKEGVEGRGRDGCTSYSGDYTICYLVSCCPFDQNFGIWKFHDSLKQVIHVNYIQVSRVRDVGPDTRMHICGRENITESGTIM